MTYTLLDSGGGKKLEQFGQVRLIRPAAQAIWPLKRPDMWAGADGEFVRTSSSQGRWNLKRDLPSEWIIELEGLRLVLRLTNFGHLGVFPEHFTSFAFQRQGLRGQRILNLFAYTGALTLYLAAQGADLVHVDASKTSVRWAQQNAELSGVAGVKWVVEDVRKFVKRELRRGRQYHGIVLDPPSFGRGTKSEVWKLETDLLGLLEDLRGLCAPEFSFVQLSAHSPGVTPVVLQRLLAATWEGGKLTAGELLLPEAKGGGGALPSGACCVLTYV